MALLGPCGTATVKTGDFFLIQYAVPGPAIYHSRLIVLPHPHEADRAFVVTPDNDFYDEDLKPTSDIAAAIHLPCFRAYPLRIAASDVYEFRVLPTQAKITRAYVAACREYGVDVDPSFLVTPQTGFEATDDLPRQAPTPAGGRDGLRGLIDAIGGGSGRGVEPVRVLSTPPRDELPGYSLGGHKEPPASADGDLRTIAVGYDKKGIRYRHSKDAIDRMSEEEFHDFPIQGPRTLLWMLRWFADNGGSPNQWFQHFKADGRFSDGDPTIEELGRSCQLLTYMAQYDQLNVGNLAVGEAICRNITAVCMTHKDKFVSKTDSPELDIIYGRANAGSLLPSNPKLMDWLGEETRKTNVAQKELRKAREERALLKPKNKAK